MSLLNRFAASVRAGVQTFRRSFSPARTRGYDAARMGRLFADWLAASTSGDAEIRASLRLLVDRSRDLERNNDYFRGYLGDCEDNIVGAIDNDLRMDAGEYRGGRSGSSPQWVPDDLANRLIEEAWAEWGRKGTCTVCGRFSWHDVKKLAVRTTPRDGNFIVRHVRGIEARNRFGYALQLLEVDHLDLSRFERFADGREIRFGIEFDSQSRPIAYHLRVRHPGDSVLGTQSYSKTERFGAEEITHLYVADRTSQSIGVPWVVSAITRLRQLGEFETAAVVAARLGASKMGFFTKVPGQTGGYGGESDGSRMTMDAAPGSFEELPEGWDLATWDPQYPNIEAGVFKKAILQGVAAGLRTSYISLGNDLEAVNYSSARVGLLDERETWKMHQIFFRDSFFRPVFAEFLFSGILNGAIALPMAKFAKFNRPRFKARRWPWVDPLKDIQSAREAIALKVTSRRQVVDEMGGDIEDVFADLQADETLAAAHGIDLALPTTGAAPAPVSKAEDGEDPEPGQVKPPASKAA